MGEASTTSASRARPYTRVGGEEEREETVHTNSHLPLLWDRLHSSHLAAQAINVLAEGDEAAAAGSQLGAHCGSAHSPAGHHHIPERERGRGEGRGGL